MDEPGILYNKTAKNVHLKKSRMKYVQMQRNLIVNGKSMLGEKQELIHTVIDRDIKFEGTTPVKQGTVAGNKVDMAASLESHLIFPIYLLPTM
jgi:hypothetical protein